MIAHRSKFPTIGMGHLSAFVINKAEQTLAARSYCVSARRRVVAFHAQLTPDQHRPQISRAVDVHVECVRVCVCMIVYDALRVKPIFVVVVECSWLDACVRVELCHQKTQRVFGCAHPNIACGLVPKQALSHTDREHSGQYIVGWLQ